ncbi:class II glutamine amidotransferase [Patescibacteria group bacterium]|nr:class II glutamine amidotransferase [Patescibacteria group bacterium]
MCRLLAIAGTDLSGQSDTVRRFGNLAATGKVAPGSNPGHMDGWGLVAYRDGRLVYQQKEADQADHNPVYTTASAAALGERPTVVIGHLRKTNEKPNRENSHPFTQEGLSFCHNGAIFEPERLPLDAVALKQREGTTDSERFFLYLLQRLRTGLSPDPVTALRDAFYFIRDNLGYSALNIVLSDGSTTWVCGR